MQAPGVCFVCNSAPAAGYVDTLQNFTPGFPHALAGAMYICDGCVKAAAESAGFYADDTVRESAKRAEVAEGKFQHVIEHVETVAAGLTQEALQAVAYHAPVAVGERSAATDAAEAAKPKAKKAPAKKAEATDAPADAEPVSE